MKTLDKLSDGLVHTLQGEKVVSLVTLNRDTGMPQLTTVSWVLSNRKGTQIHIAVSHKAECIKNILVNDHVILGVIGAGSCYSIQGSAFVSPIVKRTMKFQVITVDVEEVKDVIFYGGKITSEPQYEKSYNPVLAEQLDEEAYQLLKQYGE